MSEALEHASAEAPSLREAVVVAARRWAVAQRALIEVVARLDESGEWTLDDASTCAQWVADAVDIDISTAREWVRVGRALELLPATSAAFADGRLSYSKVRALTRVATPENEVELSELAEQVPASRLAVEVAAWLEDREGPEDTQERHRRARALWWRRDPDGMVTGTFRLPPVDAACITRPVDALVKRGDAARSRAWDGNCDDPSADASSPPTEVGWPSIAQQRADALVRLVRSGCTDVTTEIVVHVGAEGAALEDGTPVPGSVVERLAPASFFRVLIRDAERRPVNLSHRRRHPTARQRRFVWARDGGCVDCGATELLEFDHLPDHAETKHTRVDELELRCWSCHRARKRSEGQTASAAPTSVAGFPEHHG